MKTYMLTWHPWYKKFDSQVDRQHILDVIDKMPEVENWRAAIGAIFLATDLNARQLSDKIHQSMPDLTFLVVPAKLDQVEGWADRKTWDFIRRPKRVGST
jgi:hypothetical protein